MVHGGEVGVLERLLRGDANGGIVDQHAAEEVQRLVVRAHDVRQALGRPHWERFLEVWQRGDARPHLLRGSAQNAENSEQLVDLAISREQRVARQHFCEDAAQTPDIYGRGVVAGAKQNLGRAVPQGDDLFNTKIWVSQINSICKRGG